jgi:DNA polymerase elongation subunit (family B)
MANQTFFIYDIETTAIPFENFSESQQEHLLRGAKNEEETAKKKSEMALTPMTSQVATIGLKIIELDNEGQENILKTGALMFNPNIIEDEVILEKETDDNGNEISFHQSEEKDVLQGFWNLLAHYKNATLITFNGRNFDAPFLMLRSALLEIVPTRNLMEGTKFNYPLHIDLLDELTFFTQTQYGATRRFNFDFYTQAFGLESPKSKEVNGSVVSDLFAQGEYSTIAHYCLRDVTATWQLFKRIRKYLFI